MSDVPNKPWVVGGYEGRIMVERVVDKRRTTPGTGSTVGADVICDALPTEARDGRRACTAEENAERIAAALNAYDARAADYSARYEAGMRWAEEHRKGHWLTEEDDWDAVMDFMARAYAAGVESCSDKVMSSEAPAGTAFVAKRSTDVVEVLEASTASHSQEARPHEATHLECAGCHVWCPGEPPPGKWTEESGRHYCYECSIKLGKLPRR